MLPVEHMHVHMVNVGFCADGNLINRWQCRRALAVNLGVKDVNWSVQ